jgi:hypothetical protein
VEDASDSEAVRLLRQRLPDRAAERVESEFCRRKRASKLVTLGNLSGTEVEIVNWILAFTGAVPRNVSRGVNGGIKIDCVSDLQKNQLLACHGRTLSNGATLLATPSEFFLSSEDVISIVSEFLEQKQRCDDFRRAPRRGIARVAQESVPGSQGEEHSGGTQDEYEDAEVAGLPVRPPQGQTPSNRGSANPSSPSPSNQSQKGKKGWNDNSKKSWDDSRKKFWADKKKRSNSQDPPSKEPSPSAPPPAGGKGKGGK